MVDILISNRMTASLLRSPSSLSHSSMARGASFAIRPMHRTRSRLVSSEGTRLRIMNFDRQPRSFQGVRTKTTIESTSNSMPGTANRFSIPTLGLRQQCLPKQRKGLDGARRYNGSSGTVADAAKAPSLRTLRWVSFTTGLPFIGFGFMDNAILIIAGDAIDTSLGVTLGISTMCAAALGNIISDLAGIGCAAYIEDFCATTLKLPVPKLSAAQRQLRSVRMASQGGMAIGMTIGCLLGMLPLLFIDTDKAEKLRERARLTRLYQDVLNEAKSLVEAESTCLYLRVDKDTATSENIKDGGVGILPGNYHPSLNGEYLYAMFYVEPTKRHTSTTNTLMRMVSGGDRISQASNTHRSDNSEDSRRNDDIDADDAVSINPPAIPKPLAPLPDRVIPIGKGIVSRAVLTGTTWNISGNLMDEPDFFPLSIETTRDGRDVECDREHFRDCVIVPILNGRGKVIAVLEALNKNLQPHDGDNASQSTDEMSAGFTEQDVEILMSLASHVSVSLQNIYHKGTEDFGLRDTIRILKEGKGIKRSITRRPSIVGSDSKEFGERDLVKTSNGVKSNDPSPTGRKKSTLFPE